MSLSISDGEVGVGKAEGVHVDGHSTSSDRMDLGMINKEKEMEKGKGKGRENRRRKDKWSSCDLCLFCTGVKHLVHLNTVSMN